MISPKPEKYEKFFAANCLITCLHSEFLLKGSLGKAGLFLTNKSHIFNIYLNSENKNKCLQEGLELYKTQQAYDNYFTEFKKYVQVARQNIMPKYKQVPEKLTLEEFQADVRFIGRLWYYYGFTEFPYTDLAFREMQKSGNVELRRRLEEISTFKFEAREVMNAYFFTDGVIQNLLKYVSVNFLDGENASYLYLDELRDAFRGVKPASETIRERKICYSAVIEKNEITRFSLTQALELNKRFVEFSGKNTGNQIKGLTANPGLARGRAIVIPMLNELSKIKEIEREMKKGDVLIAETTSPELMSLCKKASAIVANQGGMLSHAAIVSRELGIPCIIQANNATEQLKTGDYIEVDAGKGIVRKIS